MQKAQSTHALWHQEPETRFRGWRDESQAQQWPYRSLRKLLITPTCRYPSSVTCTLGRGLSHPEKPQIQEHPRAQGRVLGSGYPIPYTESTSRSTVGDTTRPVQRNRTAQGTDTQILTFGGSLIKDGFHSVTLYPPQIQSLWPAFQGLAQVYGRQPQKRCLKRASSTRDYNYKQKETQRKQIIQ